MQDFKKYLVELIGTFFLVFTVGSAVLMGGNGVIPAISIGFVLMIMVYAGAHISGGHYNPAVSLAAVFRGALPIEQLLPYWLSQLLGGLVAAILVLCIAEPVFDGVCPHSIMRLIVGEFLFTFALCYVVLQTATTKSLEGNQFYGLAIGSTVTVGAFAVGGILCFGAFNPVVAISLGILSTACWNCVAITIASNIVAAITAAFVYKLVNTEPEPEPEETNLERR